MPYKKKKYTLYVYRFATGIVIDEIHTESMLEPGAINQASSIVDAAKKKDKLVEVVIKRVGYKKRVALVTPDQIILD